MHRRAVLLFLLFGLFSCTKPRDHQADFLLFEDEYFNGYWRFQPTAGVMAGAHQYDDEVEDLSAASFQNRIAALKAQQKTLAAIDRNRLAEAQQLDHRVLESQILAELHELETLATWRHSPLLYVAMPGNAVDPVMKRSFAPKPRRLRSVVHRLRGVPAMLAALRANVTRPPKEFTDLAIRLAEGSVGFFRKDLADWAKDADGGDIVLRQQFADANANAAAAMEQTAKWLREDLQKRSNGSFAIGADAFARKLLLEEMVDTPLPQLLAIGERNLEKDYQDFVATARKIDPTKTPEQVVDSLAATHPKADDLVPAVRRTAEGIRQFLVERDIVTLPSESRVRIVETPPYQRSGGYASMDTPGAFETVATEAYYNITPVETNWTEEQKEQHLRLFHPWVIDIITIHEAYPGHFVQFLYAPQFPTKTRKLIISGTNVEGWAHYTEQMMIEEGFGGNDPRYRLAQLSEALLRDCRYVAGIKLHTQGWTVEQATQLFIDKGFQPRQIAFEEARRGTYNPTYLYYTLGKLQVYKLRADYQAKLGAAYSLKKFHDVFLKQGGVPLPIVRRVMLGGDGGPLL